MNHELAAAVIRWMVNGNVGLSSKTMAFCALGVRQERTDYPLDPADFNRCLLLVSRIPEIRNAFPKITKLSPEWHAVIGHWDELESLFISEAGLGWSQESSAPKTYERMDEILRRK